MCVIALKRVLAQQYIMLNRNHYICEYSRPWVKAISREFFFGDCKLLASQTGVVRAPWVLFNSTQNHWIKYVRIGIDVSPNSVRSFLAFNGYFCWMDSYTFSKKSSCVKSRKGNCVIGGLCIYVLDVVYWEWLVVVYQAVLKLCVRMWLGSLYCIIQLYKERQGCVM